MIIHGTIKYNTPLVIKREDIYELNSNLSSSHYDRILYIGTTIHETDVLFSALDELLAFRHLEDDRLCALRIIGFSGRKRALHITLGWLAERRSELRYPDVLICEYDCLTGEDELWVKNSLESFQKSTKVKHPKWERHAQLALTLFACFLSAFIVYIFFSHWNIHGVGLRGFFGLFLLLYALVSLLIWGISHIVEELFPPVVFAWGEEEAHHGRRVKLRDNLLFGVVISLGMSIFSVVLSILI